jgi:hypothetical protein
MLTSHLPHQIILKGPQTVYALLSEIRKRRSFVDARYDVVRRRVEALGNQDYLMRVGTARALPQVIKTEVVNTHKLRV